MKHTIILLFTSFITVSAFSQQYACRHDTIHFYLSDYRGKLTWQQSVNGADWSSLPGTQRDTIDIVAANPAYYRAEVIEGTCNPYYSEAIHLMINELPVITLDLPDTTCLNESAFKLTGGIPGGGSYWGTGVIDGKFSPAVAGTGLHQVFYSYRDSSTHCADTADTFIRVIGVPNHAAAGVDQPFVAADSVLLDANIPENGTGTWSVVSGTMGHFSNAHSPKAWFIKEAKNLSFTLKWSISGRCGDSSDEVDITFFQLSKNPCPGAPTVTDADGNVYPTIQIGEQCWMARNLNVGRYITSTQDIVPHSNMTNNSIIEKYGYQNKPENCNLYGGLYEWNEAMNYTTGENAQGICPDGWHIPGQSEWEYLTAYFPTFKAGANLKVGGSSGFEGYLAGDRNASGDFYSFDAGGFWWQSNTYTWGLIDDGFLREIEACNDKLTLTHFPKQTGVSVRCIKNKGLSL